MFSLVSSQLNLTSTKQSFKWNTTFDKCKPPCPFNLSSLRSCPFRRMHYITSQYLGIFHPRLASVHRNSFIAQTFLLPEYLSYLCANCISLGANKHSHQTVIPSRRANQPSWPSALPAGQIHQWLSKHFIIVIVIIDL